MFHEIVLANQPKDHTLITFDGHVFESFQWEDRESTRYHVFMFAKIEITKDTHGRNTLSIWSKYVNEQLYGPQFIRDEVLAETQKLVTAIQEAMALYP